ncbi:hypothetical protein M8998_13360 [Sphingobacterium sp. lm-10]|uniref:hypothetical protein n=1 Tax=Sphingobacterium sp. lm-10 TaxID=2944904 RepID=UPI00201FC8E2|nr:hypothetical protein [Sphingobacterium sp. lm-10]MCL7988932.1 hypothetical protein [Sphingobacterium sp. lm-10]
MEKKFYPALILSVFLSFSGRAQEADTTNLQTATIQNTAAASNQDAETIAHLTRQVAALSRELKNNTDNINVLMASKDLDAQNRYIIIRQNLENATGAYRLLHTKVLGMKNYQSNRLFEPLVKDLANPESDRLGFRFDQKVTSLVEENVKPKKRNIASRIHEGVSAIANNQVVSLIPVVSPAAQLTNNVMGFLRSTSVMTDDVDQATIAKMESELNSYIHFYNLLAEANTEFDYNLNAQRQELSLLQRQFYDQVRYFAEKAGLEPEARGSQENIEEYLNRLFLSLDQNYIANRLTQFEQKNQSGNRINYDQLLLSDGANDLKDANNRLEEFVGLINQLEFHYNKHYRYTELYAEKIKSALDEAATLGVTEDNIRTQLKTEIDQIRDQTNSDFRAAINMDELTKAKKSIRYTARII